MDIKQYSPSWSHLCTMQLLHISLKAAWRAVLAWREASWAKQKGSGACGNWDLKFLISSNDTLNGFNTTNSGGNC